MGSLILPPSGVVYLDANAFIYSVEEIAPYWQILEPLWLAAKQHSVQLVSSELLVVEAMMGPRKKNRADLIERYERILGASDVQLVQVSLAVLKEAVDVRVKWGLRTPDAIHAATAKLAGCDMFLTNDAGFQRVDVLPVTLLSAHIS